MKCDLCGEEMTDRPTRTVASEQYHRECLLREGTGGIGHLIAHPYWCVQMHDPDAGLTRRQSALLVDEFVTLVGPEVAVSRWPDDPA